MALATWRVADALNCKAIITATLSGYTTRQVARVRPKTPIICVTPSETTYKRTALLWGSYPLFVAETFNSVDEMVRIVVNASYKAKLVDIGDSIVIIAGVPFGIAGQTNFLKLHIVGESGELDVQTTEKP